MGLSVILPTYNESRNIRPLLRQIRKVLPEAEVVIVDDNSPDGTGRIAQRLQAEGLARAVHREKRLGLSGAVALGFSVAKGDILAAMDADGSHPPETLVSLVKEVRAGADIAVASRRVFLGRVEHWPAHRRLVSRVATFLAGFLTDVKDPLSGCFCLRRRVIKGVRFESRGYKILLEILVKGSCRKVVEVPYVFRSRKHGASKLGPREHFSFVVDWARLIFWKYL